MCWWNCQLPNRLDQWHQVKNLHLQDKLTTSGEDHHSKDTLSDNNLETPMLYMMQSDDLPRASESAESDNEKNGDDTRNAKEPQDIDVELLPPEESSHFFKEELIKDIPHQQSSVWSWDQGRMQWTRWLISSKMHLFKHDKFPWKLEATIKRWIYRLWSHIVSFVAWS